MFDTDTESSFTEKPSAGQPADKAGENFGTPVSVPVPVAASGVSSPNAVMINVVIPLLLLAAGAAVVVALGTVKPESRPPADTTLAGRLKALTPIRVARVRSLASTGKQLQLEVDGTTVPYREARVAAEVAGRIVFKADECEAGAVVKANQLLMRIDPEDYELDVERLSRMKEQEYQALMEVDQEMKNAQRLIDVARKDVKLQQDEVDRQESLPKGFSSRGEIDKAKRALLQATQQLVTSENQIDLLKKRRIRLEASEKLATTQLKVAQLNLKRVEIRAPIDGVIVREDVDLNTFVTRGTTLVTIDDTSKVEVATSLRMDQLYWVLDQREPNGKHDGPKADADKLQTQSGYDLPETPAIIEYELAGREGQLYRWKGRLLSYDGIGLDATTRTVPVRVVVDNPQQYFDDGGTQKEFRTPTALLRGMFVRVKLLLEPKTPLVVIPGVALKPGNRVWLFNEDDSVLDLKAEEGKDDSITEDAITEDEKAPSDAPKSVVVNQRSENEVDESKSPTKPFDPAQWTAGRVVVQKAINPIDTLTVASSDSTDQRGERSLLAAETRMWVCEVRDQSFGDGSFVVTSPLGSVADVGVPARAETKTMNPQIEGTDASSGPQTKLSATLDRLPSDLGSSDSRPSNSPGKVTEAATSQVDDRGDAS